MRVVWNDNLESGLHFFISLSFHPGAAAKAEFPVAVFPMCEELDGRTPSPPPQQNAVQPITHTEKHTDSIKSNNNQTLPQLREKGKNQMQSHKKIFWLATIHCEEASKLSRRSTDGHIDTYVIYNIICDVLHIHQAKRGKTAGNICFWVPCPASPSIFDVAWRAKEKGASYPEHQSLCLNVQALISSASLTKPTYDCVCWGSLWQTLQRRGSFKL